MFSPTVEYTPLDLLWGNFELSENSVTKRKKGVKDPVCQLYSSQFNNQQTRTLIDNAIADYSAYFPFGDASSAPAMQVLHEPMQSNCNVASNVASAPAISMHSTISGMPSPPSTQTPLSTINPAPITTVTPVITNATPTHSSNVAPVVNAAICPSPALPSLDAMYAPERERPMRSMVIELLLYVMTGLILIIVMDITMRMGFRAHLSNSGL